MSFDKIIAFATVFLAFISCLLTYRLSRPKIKVKLCENPKSATNRNNIFANEDGKRIGQVVLDFENCTSHQTQIKDIWFKHKGTCYHVANSYTEYSKSKFRISVESASEFPIKENLYFNFIPFNLASFETKNNCFIFYEFPDVNEESFSTLLFVEIAGKKLPKILPVTFTKTEVKHLLPYEYLIKRGKSFVKIESNIPLRNKNNKVISTKRKR